MVSPQTLSDDDRRLLARWAVACAERVLALFEADADAVRDVREAAHRARRYGAGESSAAAEIRKRLIAATAASRASTPAGAAAARSVGQAAAVAHMGAHALGAAAYAVKAVSLSAPDGVSAEILWQLAELRPREREALRKLPLLGSDPSGPLGRGLLATGILGEVVQEIQRAVLDDPAP